MERRHQTHGNPRGTQSSSQGGGTPDVNIRWERALDEAIAHQIALLETGNKNEWETEDRTQYETRGLIEMWKMWREELRINQQVSTWNSCICILIDGWNLGPARSHN